ncbi:hypothetical protein [Cochleicola gelatinilyticus]|uniref:Uncharacterized protein n=1 Tax=Cochleicola gelatinilyticus TaxID=1763537 RepID=A0A167J455_9FLAO|nr:hypothetical protein [Cochleicola gelatinilyticus]OAB80316.1 hypothetical protein ULVI_06155 [Cochleicola gelatinilyticus]
MDVAVSKNKNIIVSDVCHTSLQNVLVYFDREADEIQKNLFQKNLIQLTKLFSKGVSSDSKNDIQSILLSENIKLFYKVSNDAVQLLLFWNSSIDEQNTL